MAEYIVQTDKPIRLDEILHLHGIHHYSVQRLGKHGDLIDRDAFANSIPEAEPDGFENCSRCTCMTKDEMVEIILDAEVVLEANK